MTRLPQLSRAPGGAVDAGGNAEPDASPALEVNAGPRPEQDAAGIGVASRYQTLFALGRGGMGHVELALERAGSEAPRLVALKRLLPESARDPRRKAMFLREARLAAALLHPNVVHATAFGELADELYLCLEYVEGETLSRVLGRCREGGETLTPGHAAFILAEVCDGLHAAHELRNAQGDLLNVVHRDVSPHNVMIAYTGEVKVLDFGVAKFDAGGGHTRTGEVKGRMAYMSPEQAMGDELDRRSDLFGVGAVLFECVAGRPMWDSETDMEVMRRLALEDPPSLDSVCPDAPPSLVALTSRLVSRERRDRPPTASEVSRELRAFVRTLASEPDGDALRLRMNDLFATDANDRRARVAAALASLGTEPGTMEHAPGKAQTAPPTREHSFLSRRTVLTAVAAAAVLAGGALGVARAVGQSQEGASADAMRPRNPLNDSPARSASPDASAEPRPTRLDSRPIDAPQAPGSSPLETPAVAAPAPAHRTPAPSRVQAPTPSANVRPNESHKLPDVDPAPF